MRTKWRQYRGVLPLVALVTLTASTPLREPECVQADRWVAKNTHQLPATFEGLAKYSPVYQQRIVVALPMGSQQELWRQHLENARSSSWLNEQQKEVVDIWLHRLPTFFDARATADERKARMYRTKPMIEANFTQGLAQRVFYVSGLLASVKTQVAGTANLCNCDAASKYKNGGCPTGSCTSRSGCGLGGHEPCSGSCVLDDM